MENLQDKKSCACCGQVKTLDNFKMSRFGYRVSVCTECANKKRNETLAQKKKDAAKKMMEEQQKLSEREELLRSFTPRELMAELSRRGYKGELTFTQTIDINNF